MFMYLEDDTDVTWQALQSWAADTEVTPFLHVHASDQLMCPERTSALPAGSLLNAQH
jgi:hypothetical protein